MAELMEAKQKLLNKLGPNFTRYLQLLGKWFRGTITKDEFDTNAKQLISTSFVSEHNRFWLAFLDHCANSASTNNDNTDNNNQISRLINKKSGFNNGDKINSDKLSHLINTLDVQINGNQTYTNQNMIDSGGNTADVNRQNILMDSLLMQQQQQFQQHHASNHPNSDRVAYSKQGKPKRQQLNSHLNKSNNSQNITITNNYTDGLSHHKDTNLNLFPRVDEKHIRSLASDGRFISMSSPLTYLPYPPSLERSPNEPLEKATKLSFCHRDRCLPNKLMAHMRIFVIAWEMGLDSVDDKVAQLVNLALQYFLKNIITEVICSKTAYRLRENKFRYAFGVKPINPYSTSSNKIYRANLEYDPYQIEATRTNSSLVDTYAYNDSLFPSRLHENQAIFEYACSVSEFTRDRKRLKKADESIGASNEVVAMYNGNSRQRNLSGHKSTLFHLFMTLMTNKCVIPSHALYCVNVERVIAKLSI